MSSEPASAESPPPDVTQPAGGSERLVAIDVVRGVAVLGILAMNILSIGLPGAARLNPLIAGGFDGADRLLWWVGYLFFDEKMIALFSMLFGAGLVLQSERAAQTGRSPARLFYRRVFVLLLIGLAHAYLVWDGDILVTYALCGMLVYPLRRLPPRLLIPLGVLLMLVAIAPGLLIAGVFADARVAAERVEQLERDGAPVPEADRAAAATWAEIRRGFRPSADELTAALAQARSEGYAEHVRRKAPEALAVHTQLFVAAFLWLVGGRMLIGMALMKLGVFAGARSRGFYLALAAIGYGVGLPLVYLCGDRLIAREFDPVAIFGGGLLWNSYAGMFVALGHIGLTVTVFKAGWLTGFTGRLAAVGRMALTNYLVQSLVCTTLFCGWGFGLIGRLDRTALYGVMTSIWLAQLIYSPLWLARFRFGPAEWLWRTLTYGRWQPLRHPV
jgi:uncharacterized protein